MLRQAASDDSAANTAPSAAKPAVKRHRLDDIWYSLNTSNQNQIKSNYFIVRLKVDQRAGQLSLPHLGITKTEKIELKHKTDEQISPVNGLEPWDQSDRQKQTKVEDKIFWKGRFSAQSETVKKWWKVIAVCSKLNRHVRMMVAERGMNNLDEESWVM